MNLVATISPAVMVTTRGSRGNKKIDEMLHPKSEPNEQAVKTSGPDQIEVDEEQDAMNEIEVGERGQPKAESLNRDKTKSIKRRKTNENNCDGDRNRNLARRARKGADTLLQKWMPGDRENAQIDEAKKWEILERGHIFFFYRPKVQDAEKTGADKAASSIGDVQNTHM